MLVNERIVTRVTNFRAGNDGDFASVFKKPFLAVNCDTHTIRVPPFISRLLFCVFMHFLEAFLNRVIWNWGFHPRLIYNEQHRLISCVGPYYLFNLVGKSKTGVQEKVALKFLIRLIEL